MAEAVTVWAVVFASAWVAVTLWRVAREILL